MPGRLEFETQFATSPTERRSPEAPLRVLVLGDFSARASRIGDADERAPLGQRSPLRVDVDTIESVLQRLRPVVRVAAHEASARALAGIDASVASDAEGADGGPEELRIEALDHFHPDHLYGKLSPFAKLRDLRRRLLDPAEGAAAAAELVRDEPPSESTDETGPVSESASPSDGGSMFERLLGGEPKHQRKPSRDVGGLDRLIRKIVEPHIVPDTGPDRTRLVAAVDAAAGDLMRVVLRAPAFMELEGRWRALARLVSGVTTEDEVQFGLLDATVAELRAALAEAGGDSTALDRSLVDEERDTLGGAAWSVLVADLAFGADVEDLRLLEALGGLAARAGAPLLAGAEPSLLGCASARELPDPGAWRALPEEVGEVWARLRRGLAAPWTGLALPRVLARLPYGQRTDEIDSFAFEELSGRPEDGELLWSSASLACAELLVRAFEARGWSMSPGDELEVLDLPAYSFDDGEGAQLAPCAEVLLSERAVRSILDHGLMPMVSHKAQNVVRLARFQSIADPPTGLRGPWD